MKRCNGPAAFWRTVGYQAAVVADGPGLVHGRLIACASSTRAAGALHDGVASAPDIDTAMKLGTNYPHGPLASADHLGLDMVLGIMTGLYEEWGEDRYRPTPLLRRMVLAGRRTKAPTASINRAPSRIDVVLTLPEGRKPPGESSLSNHGNFL